MRNRTKEERHKAIMACAGLWSYMSDEEFRGIKETVHEMRHGSGCKCKEFR